MAGHWRESGWSFVLARSVRCVDAFVVVGAFVGVVFAVVVVLRMLGVCVVWDSDFVRGVVSGVVLAMAVMF